MAKKYSNQNAYTQDYNSGQEEQIEKISLAMLVDDLWKGLKKYCLLMLAIIILCSGAFYVRQKLSFKPIYESYATFVVVVSDGYGYDIEYYNRTTATQLSKTFPDLIKSTELMTVVAEDLGIASVPANITAEVMENTALFTLRVEADDAQLSYDILQSVIKNYPKIAEFVIGDSQLTLLDESGIPASPSNTVSYKVPLKNGALAGLVISLVFLFTYALTRRTVRTTDDMEKRVSLAYLGSIPYVKSKKRSAATRILMDSREHSNILGDCFRSLRTRVLQEINKDNKIIFVTSALDGEGKTTVAVNLAIALALKNKKVLLIEGNFRTPSIIRALGLEALNADLAQVLNGTSTLADAMISYKKTTLHVLPVNEAHRSSAELLSSNRMQKMMGLLAKDYEYIVIDGPSNSSSDASILARYADSAVLVVKQDTARIDKIMYTIETVRDADLQAIGYVINSTQVGLTGYGYGYGQSYGYGYGYGYGNGYGYGYGYGKEKKSRRKTGIAVSVPSSEPVQNPDAENIDDEFSDSL